MAVAMGRAMPADDAREQLTSRGWEDGAGEKCWLDCTAPGLRREWTDRAGQEWEIFLCPDDAAVLEQGAWNGDYSGAPLPEDSQAREWPWLAVERAVAV
jgi:YD repeat-containing protein